jgi:pilus assembly protein CpaC
MAEQVGKEPKPLPPAPKDYEQFVIKTIEPEATLDLVVGLPKILVFKDPPKRVQMDGDEKSPVAGYTVITEREISVVGKRPGRTVLNLWFPTDPKDPTKLRVLSYLVRVSPDPQTQVRIRAQLEQYYRQLEKEINCAFPDSQVCLRIVGNKLLVGGQARDIAEATQILQIIIPRTIGQRSPSGKDLTTIVEHGLAQSRIQRVPEEFPDMIDEKDAEAVNPYFRAGLQVVNLLRVPGEQQVMLRVVVAEVDRTAARNLGFNYSIKNDKGVTVFANTTGIGGQATTAGVAGAGALLASGVNLPVMLDNGQISLAITALKQHTLARTLAEPTLVAINGQTASFRAGGEFPVPVVTGFTSAGLQGVSFVPFGVQLQFTPVITDKSRIRLSVQADVSTRDLQSSANVAGTNVPGLNSRTFQTTVELREGQTMAVAGLIQKNYAANAARVPFLGNIPVLGRFVGGQDSSSAGEQELIVLVTPMLQHPLDPHHTRPLPGSDLLEPNDVEFYVHGRLESHHPIDYRSPVRTDCGRMHQYRDELRGHPGLPEYRPQAPVVPSSPNGRP